MPVKFTFLDGGLSNLSPFLWTYHPFFISIPGVLQQSDVTFNVDLLPSMGVTLNRQGNFYARTGLVDPSHFSDDDGVPATAYVVQENRRRFTPQQVADFAPTETISISGGFPAPINALMLPPPTLQIAGPNLMASGHVAVVVWGNNTLSVGYNYTFSLTGTAHPLDPDQILGVKSLGLDFYDVAGNWWLNLLLDILQGILEREISRSMETTIKNILHEEISTQLAQENVPEETVITVEKIEITPTGVIFYATGTVNLQYICPSSVNTQTVSGRAAFRDANQIQQMHHIRDRLLKGTPRGEAYMTTFKRHSPELVRILIKHPKLMKDVDKMVEAILRDFGGDVEQGQLSEETAKRVIDLGNRVKENASLRLRAAIEVLTPEVYEYTQRVPRNVLQDTGWPPRQDEKAEKPGRTEK